MSTELIANSPTPGTAAPIATLAAPITSTGATSITTSNAAPSTLQGGQCRIVVWDGIKGEVMLATAGQNGTGWTVTRGASLPSPDTCTSYTFAAGAQIFHDLTAGGLMNLIAPLASVSSPTLSGSFAEVNLMDPRWGVVGDDTTDDWAAINSVINAVGSASHPAGTTIRVPSWNSDGSPRVYRLSKPLHIARTIELVAEGGPNTAAFKFDAGVHGLVFHSAYEFDWLPAGGYADNSVIRGLNLLSTLSGRLRKVTDAVTYSTTTSTSISGTVTSIPCAALPVAVPSGTPIGVMYIAGEIWQAFETNAPAASGATSLSVVSTVAIGTFATGSQVTLGVMTSASGSFTSSDVGLALTQDPGAPTAEPSMVLQPGTSIATVVNGTTITLTEPPSLAGATGLSMWIAGGSAWNQRCPLVADQMSVGRGSVSVGWGGHGFDIVAAVLASNANGWTMHNPFVSNVSLDGIHVQGDDANAGTCYDANIENCGSAAIRDNSFLGNSWVHPEIADCTYGYLIGDYEGGGNVSTSTLIHPYTEGGTGYSALGEGVMVFNPQGNMNIGPTYPSGSIFTTSEEYGNAVLLNTNLELFNATHYYNYIALHCLGGDSFIQTFVAAVNGDGRAGAWLTAAFTGALASAALGVSVDGHVLAGRTLAEPLVTPAYGTTVTPDALNGPWQTITVTNGAAFTIAAPTDTPVTGSTAELTIEILNSSGGAMGAITWNAAFVFAGQTWTNPASTKRRFARFRWNGSEWVCLGVAAADY